MQRASAGALYAAGMNGALGGTPRVEACGLGRRPVANRVRSACSAASNSSSSSRSTRSRLSSESSARMRVSAPHPAACIRSRTSSTEVGVVSRADGFVKSGVAPTSATTGALSGERNGISTALVAMLQGGACGEADGDARGDARGDQLLVRVTCRMLLRRRRAVVSALGPEALRRAVMQVAHIVSYLPQACYSTLF